MVTLVRVAARGSRAAGLALYCVLAAVKPVSIVFTGGIGSHTFQVMLHGANGALVCASAVCSVRSMALTPAPLAGWADNGDDVYCLRRRREWRCGHDGRVGLRSCARVRVRRGVVPVPIVGTTGD